MSALAGGVTIVTTRDRAAAPCGLTATATCLVSHEPPLLLVCVARDADCHAAFLEADAFALHLLRAGQEPLARRFAARDPRKFDGLSTEVGRLGPPLLPGGLGVVECRVVERHGAGDHTIVIGRAEAWRIAAEEGDGPLLYYRRAYGRLAAPDG